jgi:hypothetical protein
MPRFSSASSQQYFQPILKPFKLIKYLENPNPQGIAQSDAFGSSVAVSSDYIVVGAPGEQDALGVPSQGIVYIYSSTGEYVRTILNPNPVAPLNAGDGDSFGTSVAVNSEYVIVGAPGENDATDNNGKAYVFDITDGSLVYTFNDPNPNTTEVSPNGDAFGSTVALTENYASVCAYREDEVGIGDDTGWTYIFDLSNGNLDHSIENPNLDNEDEYPGDQIGEKINTLAITDTWTMVGNWRENEPGALGQGDSGAFFLFNNSTGATDQSIYNPKDDAVDADDRFGYAVDLNENFAAVGCPGEDTDGTNSGRVYVYNPSTGNLVTTISNPNNFIGNNNDRFGESVAINDNYLAVGALDEDDDAGISSGVVYIFNTSDWSLANTLENPNKYTTSTNDRFGYTIRLANNILVVGVPAESQGSGAVYIYKV